MKVMIFTDKQTSQQVIDGKRMVKKTIFPEKLYLCRQNKKCNEYV